MQDTTHCVMNRPDSDINVIIYFNPAISNGNNTELACHIKSESRRTVLLRPISKIHERKKMWLLLMLAYRSNFFTELRHQENLIGFS